VTSPPPALSDGELARRALGGEQAAFASLMEQHRNGVYRLVLTQTGDPDEAVDITQEAFIAAFAALDRYDAERPFKVWISRIAINKCRDWARRRAVRRFFTFATPIEEAYEIADLAATPEEQLSQSREQEKLIAAIAQLPPKLKEVLILRTIEEFSQNEVAQTLGITSKAVEMRLYRARNMLLGLLRD